MFNVLPVYFTALLYPLICLVYLSLSYHNYKDIQEIVQTGGKYNGSKHLNDFNNGGTTVPACNMQRNEQTAFERKIACKLKLYHCAT